MRTQAERDAELDALYARAAVRVGELAQLEAGPALVAGLHPLRGAPMDAATALRAAALWVKLGSWCDAEVMVPLTAAVQQAECLPGADRLGAMRLMAEEFAVMTNVSAATATNRLALVGQVGEVMPVSWQALDRGQISLVHLKRLADTIAGVSPRVAQAVEAAIIPRAVEQGWTPYELAAEADAALLQIDPEGAAARRNHAKSNSDVRLRREPDEMATLNAYGPAVPMRQMMDQIDALADQMGRDGDTRNIGERRIAAMAALILGEVTDRPVCEAGLNLDLTTYLGLNDKPGQLSGYGPISADTARALAQDAALRRLITDPITGALIDLGRTRYRPTKSLDRLLAYRDRTCRFPGCHRPAVKCDKDHCPTWREGAATSSATMHCLCRRHHTLKTLRAWTVDINPDGSETWTSTLGFTYTKRPPTYRIDELRPPEPDELPDEPADDLLRGDPDPPRADDPLPEAPTITLEEYFEYADDLERRAIIHAITNYDALYRNDNAA